MVHGQECHRDVGGESIWVSAEHHLHEVASLLHRVQYGCSTIVQAHVAYAGSCKQLIHRILHTFSRERPKAGGAKAKAVDSMNKIGVKCE